MRREIVVVDGLYDDPDAIREIALNEEFKVSGNYPGTRTDTFVGGGIREHLEKILNIEIDEMHWKLGEYTGSFQFVTEGTKTWVHSDHHTDWSCLVYLHPEPMYNSGTSFYKHIESGSRMYSDNDGETIEGDGDDYDKWTREDVISNVYNRAIIFRGDLWHAADEYFGEDMETGRLFQTFFFNEVKK